MKNKRKKRVVAKHSVSDQQKALIDIYVKLAEVERTSDRGFIRHEEMMRILKIKLKK